MPSPRQIAEKVNSSSKFSNDAADYDGEAGLPKGMAPQGPQPDYAANPSNPPEPAAPARNLKR